MSITRTCAIHNLCAHKVQFCSFFFAVQFFYVFNQISFYLVSNINTFTSTLIKQLSAHVTIGCLNYAHSLLTTLSSTERVNSINPLFRFNGFSFTLLIACECKYKMSNGLASNYSNIVLLMFHSWKDRVSLTQQSP